MPFLYTTNLSEVRALAESEARVSGMPEDRIVDFVIAVGEVAANTVRHARSPGSMEIWLSGGELVCEIRDAGVITDPFVGRRPPPDGANGGHGLWLVHQICDRVDLHSDETGTVIRMYMTLRGEVAELPPPARHRASERASSSGLPGAGRDGPAATGRPACANIGADAGGAGARRCSLGANVP